MRGTSLPCRYRETSLPCRYRETSLPCRYRATSIALLCAILAACVAARPRMESAAAQVNQAKRDADVIAARDFHLQGRIAIKNAHDGGSGRFDWIQTGDAIQFELSAPLSNQTWRLEGAPGSYTLTDSKGAPRHNADARTLIFEASGWTIPMQELGYWVRGARAGSAPKDAAVLSFDASGRLSALKQNGWTVIYERYSDASNGALPIKLQAVKGEAQVKVIVQRWD
jgi:outer membrane lipoprotein LolB